MARLVLAVVLFTIFFIQLASSQDTPSQACINAGIAIGAATQCQMTEDNVDLSVLCGSECRGLINAVFDNCPTDSVR